MFSLWQQAAQNHIRLQTKKDKSKDQLVGNEAFFYLLTLNSDKLPALKCVDVFISGGSYGEMTSGVWMCPPLCWVTSLRSCCCLDIQYNLGIELIIPAAAPHPSLPHMFSAVSHYGIFLTDFNGKIHKEKKIKLLSQLVALKSEEWMSKALH